MARRGKNIEFLQAIAKKKPHLQTILDNLDNMSVDEISDLKDQLWIREVLLNEKKTRASLLNVTFGTVKIREADEKYEVKKYVGENFYTDMKLSLEIEKNTLVLFDKDTIRINTLYNVSKKDYDRLYNQSLHLGYFTILEFRELYQQSLEDKYPEIQQPNNSWFRIQR